MPRSRSRSGSLDSLGRRRRHNRRRDSPPSSSYRRRRPVPPSRSRSRSSSSDYKRRRRSSCSRSRSRSLSVERRRHRRGRRSYSRSRSPMSRSQGRATTYRSPTRRGSITNERTTKTNPAKDEADVMLKQETNTMSHLSEEDQMKLLLGFGDFDSTKGKPVEENRKSAAAGTARRETKREYRQYMNRRGGFNRLLDKV